MTITQSYDFSTRSRTRSRPVSPKHSFYEKLRKFRETWESNGGTRGTLRKARKAQRTLYPKQE
jgi:hypothetical protein